MTQQPHDHKPRQRRGADSIALLRKDHSSLASSLTAHNDAINSLAVRVTAIEEARRQRAIDEARTEEREKARSESIAGKFEGVDTKLTDLKSDIKDLKGIVNKVVWIIITAIITAIVLFMIKGGFK